MTIPEEFFGVNKPHLQYSINVVRFIEPTIVHGESDLFETKWWDYRTLHPMEATFLFAHYYVEQAKVANERRRGHNNPLARTFFKPMANINLLRCSKTARTGMWKARRKADSLGIPYDFWVHWAMKYADKCDWQYLPKPHQLYSEKGISIAEEWFVSMIGYIQTAWEAKCKDELMFGESDFYNMEVRPAKLHRYQSQHLKYLLSKVDRSINKEILLASLIHKSKVMLPELVIQHYGQDKGKTMLRRAEMYA